MRTLIRLLLCLAALLWISGTPVGAAPLSHPEGADPHGLTLRESNPPLPDLIDQRGLLPLSDGNPVGLLRGTLQRWALGGLTSGLRAPTLGNGETAPREITTVSVARVAAVAPPQPRMN